jgi:uncharacterized membrane protein
MSKLDRGASQRLRRDPRRWVRLLAALVVAFLLTAPLASETPAWAGPRSGSSFGSRSGFRQGGGLSSRSPSFGSGSYGSPGYYGGTHFGFWPTFGWGYGGFGFGPSLGTLLVVGVIGFVAVSAMRAARRRQAERDGYGDGYGDDDEVASGRAYIYKVQLALGRSARGLQDKLERFASSGDTNSPEGLASLLQQAALEILREKDSVRYAAVDSAGPMNLARAEEKLNALALAERSRFQVERVRAADGQVRTSDSPRAVGREALELVVVTLLVASRTALGGVDKIESRNDVERALASIGQITPRQLLGIEVVWTPADPDDSMTEMDVMATYPDLRGV